MFEYLLIPILLIPTSKTHTPVNGSEVFIVDKNQDDNKAVFVLNTKTTTTTTTTSVTTTTTPVPEAEMSDGKDDVLFVPNEKSNRRNVFDDVIEDDVIQEAFDNKPDGETESPHADILFISGKNDDTAQPTQLEKSRNKDVFQYMHQDTDHTATRTTVKPVLDCVNLDCDDTTEGICGVKVDRGEPRYRLFLNECYYRKVNCGFRYDENRYQEVPMDKCGMLAGHLKVRESRKQHGSVFMVPAYVPSPSRVREEPKRIEGLPRQNSGRRSMYTDEFGSYCGHTCPVACTEDYDPQCAMNMSGQKRVFGNHCLLDLSSCDTKTMWQQRPLHECVGGKKADLQNNRAFVNWMQRVGIVDKKGRLVLNK